MRVEESLAQAIELARSGRTEPAAALLDQILAIVPDEPDALQLLGLVARSRGDNDKAVELFRKSLRANPAQANVLNNLGNALLDLDRPVEAVEAYHRALALQPLYTDVHTNLGLAYLAANDPAAAIETLERVLQSNRDNAKAWSTLGRALRALGKTGEAIAAFRMSLSLRPNNVPTLHNLAVALRLAGSPGDAASILVRCAAADPRSAEIRYNLGHCYYDLARLDEAAAAYRAAIDVQPTYREAHDSLNRLYWELGDAHYLDTYAIALQRYPNDAGLLADLANRLNLEGRTAQAAELLEAALRRDVDSGAIRHRLGQACWAQRQRKAALAHYARAIEAEPEADEPRLEMARSLIILERYEDALAALAPLLLRSPFDQQAIAYQGLAWRFLGDPRADRLNDYKRFVSACLLKPPPGWGEIQQFNRRLEQILAGMHNSSRHPLEQTLRGGTQTMGELLDRDAPEIAAVRRMIEDAVRTYIDALPEDPGHVFLNRRTDAFRLAGSWSVRLRRQGFHLNHVHSQGWISSAYYVGLPKPADHEAGQQGWIKFGETGLSLGDREQVARSIKPEVGKLVLFPSYMYHGTTPFDEDGYRTTIAFDIVPV